MTEFDETVDVVVAGSGGGITGAYTAAREGLSVTLLEAGDKFGGTTAYSGGGGMVPCNAVLRRAGCDDTVEKALTYFHAVVGDRTPGDLQEAYVRGGAALIDYLESDDHFEFTVLRPDYFGKADEARLDGLRHIVAAPSRRRTRQRCRLRPGPAGQRTPRHARPGSADRRPGADRGGSWPHCIASPPSPCIATPNSST